MGRTIVFVSLLLTLVTACRSQPLEQARQQISIGTPREEAVQILSARAWYYQPCPRQTIVDDLFFFGSHKYDEADLVIVTSALDKDGNYRVRQISSFEPYAWHAAYKDCVDVHRFEHEKPPTSQLYLAETQMAGQPGLWAKLSGRLRLASVSRLQTRPNEVD